MTVLCINDEWITGKSKDAPLPVFMKEYIVIDTDIIEHQLDGVGDEVLRGEYYVLAGFDDSYSYHASNFAILPEQSADEMREEKREAIANLEHKPV